MSDREEIRVRWPHGGWLIWNWELVKWEHTLIERQQDIDAAYAAGKQAYFHNVGTHGPTYRSYNVEQIENPHSTGSQLWLSWHRGYHQDTRRVIARELI